MAGDWIKMRVWIGRDPKVIAMANRLVRNNLFQQWLGCVQSMDNPRTLDVTVRVTVTGLLQVWGVTRPDGWQDGDDLVVEKTDLETLDSISGIPSFGEAMGYVGWAVEESKGHRVRFPNFFAQNASTEELRRKKDAERKRRQRERDAVKRSADSHADTSADSHANVTGREEKRRVSKPPTPLAGDLFDQFWFAYPRKDGKTAARKAWRKLKPDQALVSRLVADVQRRAGSDKWQENGGEFIPHASTYLNGRRWEDEGVSLNGKHTIDPEIAARYAANHAEDD